MWKYVLLAIIIILVAAIVLLIYFGNKMQKKQAENQVQLDAMAQTLSMLIIDKKRLKIKDGDRADTKISALVETADCQG